MDPVRMRLMFDALIPPTRFERVLRAASRMKARVRVQKKRQKPRKRAAAPKKRAPAQRRRAGARPL